MSENLLINWKQSQTLKSKSLVSFKSGLGYRVVLLFTCSLFNFFSLPVFATLNDSYNLSDTKLEIPFPSSFNYKTKGDSDENSIYLKRPPKDLAKTNLTSYTVTELVNMYENGFDLSSIDPVSPNRFWENKKFTTENQSEYSYPKDDNNIIPKVILSGDTDLATISFMVYHKFATVLDPKTGIQYRLGSSRFVQNMMMRQALMRKLGFYIPSAKLYKNLRVIFPSKEIKEAFITDMLANLLADDERTRWITDETATEATLKYVSLETQNSDYYDFGWGIVPPADDVKFNNVLTRFSENRSYRSLIVPFSLVDVPESVNRYSTQMVSRQLGYYTIPYFMADSFSQADYYDIQWVVRRLSKLTNQDFKEIVAQALYPKNVAELVYRKMLMRAKGLIEINSLTSQLQILPINFTNVSNPNEGQIQDGKLMTEHVADVPQRLAHGDRVSPLEDGDGVRIIRVESVANLIQNAWDQVNKKIQIKTVSDYVKEYQNWAKNNFMDRFKTEGLKKALERKVESFGGWTGGPSVESSRHVMTGTYNGSDAPIQLVDSFSIGAHVTDFRSYDGIKNIFPTVGGGGAIQRNYVHVKPLFKISEANKISLLDQIVPKYFFDLVKMLKDPNEMIRFISEDLRSGEVFTISDAVSANAFIQSISGIDAILGIKPFSFMNTLGVSVDFNTQVVSQISITKNSDSIGRTLIYITERTIKGLTAGLSLNSDFYLKLLALRANKMGSEIESNTYAIDITNLINNDKESKTNTTNKAASDSGKNDTTKKPELTEAEKQEKLKQDQNKQIEISKLKSTLVQILRYNQTKALKQYYGHLKVKINSNTEAEIRKSNFLAWFNSGFEETQEMKITGPKISEPDIDPSTGKPDETLDPEQNAIKLVRSKKGYLHGRDFISAVVNLLSSFIQTKNPNISLSAPTNDNPANIPYGKAYWRLINTESDYKNAVSIIQHVWGGWSLDKENALEIIRTINQNYEFPGNQAVQLIPENDYLNIKSLDFYRVTAQLSLLPSGVRRVHNLLLQPQFLKAPNKSSSDQEKQGYFKNVFKNLIMMMTGKNNPRLASDKELYNEMVKLIGPKYLSECKFERSYRKNIPHHEDQNEFYYGNIYECLTPWMEKFLHLVHNYPKADDFKSITKWTTQVVFILDEILPFKKLVQFLGDKNYIFYVRVNGFVQGKENGDMTYFSPVYGMPPESHPEANGYFSKILQDYPLLGIQGLEINRSELPVN